MKSSTLRLFVVLMFLLSTYPLTASALTWASGVTDGVGNISGGSTDRPTVSTAIFNNKIYVVFTSNQYCVSASACAIELNSSSEQQSDGSFLFGAASTVSVPGIGIIRSASNPSLAVYGSYAYLAWTDPSGNNYISESTDMTNWSSPLSVPATPTVTSMDMVVQPGYGDLWIAYMQGASSSGSYSPIICSVEPDNGNFPYSSTSCNTITFMSQVNFNPSLTWDQNNDLYAFMAYRGSSHCLNSYINQDAGEPSEWAYYNPSDLCHDQQTSSAPSSSFYFDGYLYVAYRSNDSSQKFDYVAINTSNNSWSHVSLDDSMDGGPNLIELSTADGLNLLQPQELVNFYVDSGYLYSAYGY